VKSGEVSATELLEGAIERIERLNPELNAVIHLLFDMARKRPAGHPARWPVKGVRSS